MNDVLDSERLAIFDALAEFKSVGVLGGGTALALQLRHRRSFDFDILCLKPVSRAILAQLEQLFPRVTPLLNTADELTVSLGSVKCSFVHFPFPPLEALVKGFPLPLFSLGDLGGNKAYAIGRRGTYRDYVDIFALLNHGIGLEAIIANADKRFGDSFNARLFLQQLLYLDDLEDLIIDWVGTAHSPSEVASFLREQVSIYPM